jgi:CRP/FNR family transcriptional regulator, cyclic AMP receptor protein
MTTVNLFRHATEVKTFAAGEVIFAQGDPGDLMYVVQDGEVEIRLGERVIDSAGAGGIVGEMALVDKGPRSASAVAKTECRLVPVDQKHFEYLVSQTPHFAITVMKIIVDRLRRRMIDLGSGS